MKKYAFLLLLGLLAGCVIAPAPAEPNEAISSGWSNYRLGEFGRAILSFEAAVAATPEQGDAHLQALYGLATAWNLRRPGQDPKKAEELYREVIRLAPQDDLAAWSYLALARMKHLVPVGQDPDYVQVRAAYQEVIDRFPEHLAAKEAFIYIVATHMVSLDAEDTRWAVEQLKKYVQVGQGPFVGTAYSLLAVSYTTLNMQQERLEAEIISLSAKEVDPTNPFTEFGWAYWNIATIAEFELGDFATARTYYEKLIREYPQDQKVFGSKQALKRMDQLEANLRAEMAAKP